MQVVPQVWDESGDIDRERWGTWPDCPRALWEGENSSILMFCVLQSTKGLNTSRRESRRKEDCHWFFEDRESPTIWPLRTHCSVAIIEDGRTLL